MWSEKESVRSSTANFLNDEEVRAMAIFHGIPGGMDIHAGITEEGDPSREQWQEDEEPRIPQQSTSAGPPPYPSHLKREQKSLMKTCSQFIQLSQHYL